MRKYKANRNRRSEVCGLRSEVCGLRSDFRHPIFLVNLLSQIFRFTTGGFPTIRTLSGTFLRITLPAPTITLAPIVTP